MNQGTLRNCYLPHNTDTANDTLRTLQYHDLLDQVLHGDCKEKLKLLPPQSIDLVMTSPPYAKQRHKSYGGIKPDDYVDWFLPIADQLQRTLKDTGSFILNIKEPAVDGERHTFVIELILELKKRGWRWVEEYCWYKKNSYPGKWPNRFRNAFEHCYHFTKQKQFAMYQDAVMVPTGNWKKKRLKYLSQADEERKESPLGNDFGRKVANWRDREMVYPSNVLHLPTECSNRGHCATFPIQLPTWFIKLFTQEGDVVLDPFIGSGTTALACKELNRHFIGIEITQDYYELACRNLKIVS